MTIAKPYSVLPLIKETLKSLLKETKRDHLLKEKETINPLSVGLQKWKVL